jgi:spore germination cell wall hydrolase CwlJ-like protein
MAEGAGTPDDMNALGWAIVNRVGNRGFGRTLKDVIHHPGGFESVGGNSPLWRQSAKPGSFTGANTAAWQRAKRAAQGILNGDIYDPTNGAVFFFSWPDYDGSPESAPGDYKRMLKNNLISSADPWVRPRGTTNYFFKEKKR